MKNTPIKNWTKSLFGLCAGTGMLLFSACGSEQGNTTGTDYGYSADPERAARFDDQQAGADTASIYDRTANTEADTDTTGSATAPITQNAESGYTNSTDPNNTINSSGQNMQISDSTLQNQKEEQNKANTNKTQQGSNSQRDGQPDPKGQQ